eukprot:GHVU01007685.1.p1 GENE.GHVU01007685.1~~GHVU01007685.1.p1  ORF type:complete len:133 (-),score=1.30 GHVU01007685.1:146-544(-)
MVTDDRPNHFGMRRARSTSVTATDMYTRIRSNDRTNKCGSEASSELQSQLVIGRLGSRLRLNRLHAPVTETGNATEVSACSVANDSAAETDNHSNTEEGHLCPSVSTEDQDESKNPKCIQNCARSYRRSSSQ